MLIKISQIFQASDKTKNMNSVGYFDFHILEAYFIADRKHKYKSLKHTAFLISNNSKGTNKLGFYI